MRVRTNIKAAWMAAVLAGVMAAMPSVGLADSKPSDQPAAPTPQGGPQPGGASAAGAKNNAPGPGEVPAAVPAAGGAVGGSDDDFLKQTAGDLAIKPPDQRLDQQLLNWFGVRPWLADRGLTFNITVTADESKNLHGGADTDNDVFRHLFDFRVNYDTESVLNWKGGTFSLDFQNQNGRNGSDLYGDAQGFDNADADGRTQISELWYEQTFGTQFRVKVGKVDANTEFAAPEYASQFLNSSFGYSPTITGFPTYPDPALSLNLFWTPTPWAYLSYGVYDGGDGQPTGDHPPHTLYDGPTDFFQIAEAGVRWQFADQTLPGRLSVGVSYATGHFDDFRGGQQNGTASLYVVAEQKLFHYNFYTKDDERGVYAFAQFGTADEEVNDFRQHVSAGVSWVGPYKKENLDALGLAFTTVFFSDAHGSPYTEDSETSIEAFYNFQATQYLSIKPDLQYIVHPGGDENLNDALVATLRVTLAL